MVAAPRKSLRIRAVPQAAMQQPHSMQRSSSKICSASSFSMRFLRRGIERLVLRVNPRFDLAAHFTEPHARIHGQVAKQLEDRQGMQDDMIGQIPGLGMAGEAGTPVDDHAAGTADARATAEVELEARVLLLADDVQRDEQGHGAVFFHIKRLHVRNGGGSSGLYRNTSICNLRLILTPESEKDVCFQSAFALPLTQDTKALGG